MKLNGTLSKTEIRRRLVGLAMKLKHNDFASNKDTTMSGGPPSLLSLS
jgi:hypothetical protein